MMTDNVLDILMHSPRLALYHRRIEELLVEEAERRQQFYGTVVEDEKVEFINGEVVIQSPVKLSHNEASVRLLMLLRAYASKHQLGLVGHEKLMISLTRNDYEPDVCFFGRAKHENFIGDQMRFPAPDFIAEIPSPSTAAVDRGIKFEDYAAHGVTEYWIIDPEAQIVEQYILEGETYKLIAKTGSATLRSQAVSGFTIPARALFDEQSNMEALQQIVMS